jgi:hypothetical protein
LHSIFIGGGDNFKFTTGRFDRLEPINDQRFDRVRRLGARESMPLAAAASPYRSYSALSSIAFRI